MNPGRNIDTGQRPILVPLILPGPLQPADPLKMLNRSIQVLGAARDQILIQPLTQLIAGFEAFTVIFDGGADIRRQRIDAVKRMGASQDNLNGMALSLRPHHLTNILEPHQDSIQFTLLSRSDTYIGQPLDELLRELQRAKRDRRPPAPGAVTCRTVKFWPPIHARLPTISSAGSIARAS
jgi:hypothetical protein